MIFLPEYAKLNIFYLAKNKSNKTQIKNGSYWTIEKCFHTLFHTLLTNHEPTSALYWTLLQNKNLLAAQDLRT